MHRKRVLSTLCCGTLVLSMALGGCGQSEKENTIQLSDTSVTGTVEAIEDDTITLSIGQSMGDGQMPQQPGSGEQPGEDRRPGGDNQPPAEGQTGSSEQPGGEMSGGIMADLIIKDESVIESSDEEKAKLADIEEGDTLTVTIDSEGKITKVVIGDVQENMSDGVESYAALKEFTGDETVSDETYMSDGTDENAIHVYKGAEVILKNVKAYRDSEASTGGDNSSFYGVGADLLVTDGTAYISGGEYTTDSKGGAGIFAYGKGTVYAADATVKTSQDTSGGIHAAGGGTLYAWDMDVNTSGESSAAIRSDRGGGTMVVDGGSYISNGTGSPAIYCTADIVVKNAVLTANKSEGICVEGKNTLHLYDCTLTGNMPDNEQNGCTWNVIVYQSMSGDSEVGNSTFHMSGGSLTAKNGGMFYTTNTECTMLLSDVDITYAEENDFFLRCTGNNNARGWGQSGNNGSQCHFTADAQKMEGDIIYDSISTLDFYMKNGSTLEGAFVDDETYAGDGGNGYCNVNISEDSSWTVTGDSTVSGLHNEGTIQDNLGRTVSIVGKDGTVYVKGNSEYTITTGSYDTQADMSGADEAGTFADYKVEKPDELGTR